MSLNNFWVIFTLISVLMAARRMAIAYVSPSTVKICASSFGVFGFIVGMFVFFRLGRGWLRPLAYATLCATVAAIGSSFGRLRSRAVTSILPILVLVSMLVVLIAAIASKKDWISEET